MKQEKKSFHPCAALTILLWSLGYVWTKTAMLELSPIAIGCLRYMVAGVTMVILAFARKMKLPERKDLPWFLLSGCAGFFLYTISYNIGQASTSVTTASVIIATVPMITALLAWAVYRERLCPRQWIATVVEFSGVLILTLMNGVMAGNSGVFWLIAAAVLLSIYNLLQRRLTQRYTALQASAYSIFCGAVMLLIFLPRSASEAVQASPTALLCLVLLGVFTSGIAYVAWSEAFARAEKTSQVSNYMFLTPFLTSLLGFVVIKEIPDATTILGGGVILIGVLLFNFEFRKRQKKKQTSA